MRQNKKFRPSKRYVFSTPEAQEKLLKLSETETTKRISEIFGCGTTAVNTALRRITGKRKAKKYIRRKTIKECPIEKANKIVKKLGYKSSSHYISERGKWEFIENVKPKMQA